MKSVNSTISVSSARGGHGATTIAGALAVMIGLPLAGHDPDATRWLWPGVPSPSDTREPHVVDIGMTRSHLSTRGEGIETIAVLRGPCSFGAKMLVPWAKQLGHLVVLREPDRSLRRQDIEAALGISVAAEIAVSSRVARLADAGMLTERVVDLDEFSELQEWAVGLLRFAVVAVT